MSPKSKRGVMTKSLEQIQIENRKFILEAIHGCSYEEALKKEEGDFCHYLYQTNYGEKTIIGDVKSYGYNREKHYPNAFLIKIIGKPLTLSRVLLALKSKEDLSNPKKYELYLGITKLFYYNYAKNIELVLDLKRETLEAQSEETQRKINELSKK